MLRPKNTFSPFPLVAELKTLIWQPKRVGQPVFVNRCVEARPFVSSRLTKGMAVRFIIHRSYRFVARPFDSKSHKGFLPCNTSRLTSTHPFQKSQQTIGWLFNSKTASSLMPVPRLVQPGDSEIYLWLFSDLHEVNQWFSTGVDSGPNIITTYLLVF